MIFFFIIMKQNGEMCIIMPQNRASKRILFFQCLRDRRDGRGIIITPTKMSVMQFSLGWPISCWQEAVGIYQAAALSIFSFITRPGFVIPTTLHFKTFGRQARRRQDCNTPWCSSRMFCAVTVHMSSADLMEVFVLPYFVLQKSTFHATPTTLKSLLPYRTAWHSSWQQELPHTSPVS